MIKLWSTCVGAAMIALSACSAPTEAPPTPTTIPTTTTPTKTEPDKSNYLIALDSLNVSGSNWDLIQVGESICEAREAGVSRGRIAAAFESYKNLAIHRESILGAAEYYLCPWTTS